MKNWTEKKHNCSTQSLLFSPHKHKRPACPKLQRYQTATPHTCLSPSIWSTSYNTTGLDALPPTLRLPLSLFCAALIKQYHRFSPIKWVVSHVRKCAPSFTPSSYHWNTVTWATSPITNTIFLSVQVDYVNHISPPIPTTICTEVSNSLLMVTHHALQPCRRRRSEQTKINTYFRSSIFIPNHFLTSIFCYLWDEHIEYNLCLLQKPEKLLQ